MELFPAIDLRGGRCVRLYQGDYGRETVYQDDPVAQAQAFAAAGATWLHVVDLDAARTGEPVNRGVVAAIAAAVPIPVQSGGGVRSLAAALALVEAGVSRVVIGTAALEQPGLVGEVARHCPVAVGLDARAGDIATHGWERSSGQDLFATAARLADSGAAAVVVTEIGRDGTLVGPDLDQLAGVLAATPLAVVASGGVATAAHLRQLAELEVAGRRLAGAIVGRALYEGTVTMADALTAIASAGR